MNASTVDQVMSSDQSEDDVALLGNGRPDSNQMSDFETEGLVSEPLADSNTDLETLTFGDDFEPTPMRADLSETSSLSDLLATDFSLYEPTPIRTAAPPPPQPQAPNRTMIDNQGFPVIRPDTSIPSMGLLSSAPQQQPPPFSLVQNNNLELQKALLQLRQVQQMQQQHQRQQQQLAGMKGILENRPIHLNQAFGQPSPQPNLYHMHQQSNFASTKQAYSEPMHPQQPQPPLRMTNAALGGGVSPQQQHCPSNTAGTSGNLPEYSHAMEKLCETMRRSAMSRTMVKQLSGRSLPKQGSSRSLPKQASSRKAMLQKHLLTRKLSGLSASSGLDTATTQSLSPVPSLGHLTPTRVPSRRSLVGSKHRIARDTLAGNGSLTALQMDTANASWWLSDADSVCSGDTKFSGKTV